MAGAAALVAVDSITGTITRGYDNLGRLISETTPQGTVSYSYDTASLLTGMTYSLGSSILGNLAYSYDLAGRRAQMGGSFARTGLPQAVTSATYNTANELTQWGATALTYDLNGNLTSDGVNTYTWDARNHLASISGGSTATFQYDPLGRRTSKAVGGASTQFLYDGPNPVQELSGATPIANLLTGRGVDELFARTDAVGARHFLPDGLGSTLALTDPSGSLLTQYTYEPFGNTAVSGSTNANPYQFTGRENDGTGLYYYRARYYSSAFQRFISEDQIQFFGGMNFYAYSGADPVNYIDPAGLFTPPNHRVISREAGEAAGLSPEAAQALANAVADVDYRPGSQGTDAASANTHAMSGRKPHRRLRWQRCDEAYQGTQDQIQQAMNSGDIPQALHTIQDAWSPSHQGYPRWYGIPTPVHVWGDTFPPQFNVTQALINSTQFLEDLAAFRSGGPPLNPANYLPPNPCGP